MSSSEELKSCPVCFEKYDLKERIPRILPCIHSLCQTCINNMVKRRHVVCPQCRKKHVGPQGGATFQENVYIVASLKDAENKSGFSRCKLHNRELTFYCRAESCKKLICSKGLRGEHSSHEVVDIEEEQEKVKIAVDLAHKDAKTLKIKLMKLYKNIKGNQKNIHDQMETVRKMSKDTIDSFIDGFKKELAVLNDKHLEEVASASDQLEEKLDTLRYISSGSNNSGFLPDVGLIEKIHSEIANLPFSSLQLPCRHFGNDGMEIKMEIIKRLDSEIDSYQWSSSQSTIHLESDETYETQVQMENSASNCPKVPRINIQNAVKQGNLYNMFRIDASILDTISSLKEVIYARTAIPIDQQQFKYGVKVMTDMCTLCDYNVQNGSTLVVNMLPVAKK